MYKSILLMVAVLPAMASSIIVNGGFETNGGAGSSTFTGWTVTNESGSGGSWYVQTGTLSPLNGLPVPVPPEGSYAAMTDASGPSSQVLIQDFTVPLDATSVTLSFDYLLNNLGPDYVPGGDLDFNDSPNQQARVDILPSADGAFDTSSVLLNAYRTQSGDTLQPGAWETFSEDITSAVSPEGPTSFASRKSTIWGNSILVSTMCKSTSTPAAFRSLPRSLFRRRDWFSWASVFGGRSPNL